MSIVSTRGARLWATALLFFGAGVIFASAMDWTPFTHAQTGGGSKPSAQSVRPMTDASDAFVTIAEHVTPAVVAIQTRTNPRTVQRGQRIDPSQIPPQLRQFIRPDGSQQLPAQEGTGSGFIISPDGYIVTNNHVVADADVINVVLTDHRVFKAKLVGRDPDTDVGVIKIDATGLQTVSLGDDEKTHIGEWVLAIGNPLGLDFTVTAGIVSAKGRNASEVPVNSQRNYAITDFIQTDAAINPGNSGGPLVNSRGEVIGINTAIASTTGMYAGYGFAIPVGLARVVWQDLIDHGKVVRAALGVSITEVTPEDADAAGLKKITGVLVRQCTDPPSSSPACKAGVQEGDVITTIDGKPVDRVSGLQRAVREHKPGDVVDVQLMRFGQAKDYKVKLIQAVTDPAVVADAGTSRTPKREPNAGAKIGITVQPVTDKFAQTADLSDRYRGLLVADVDPSGPARDKLAEGEDGGDIIVGVLPSGDQIKSDKDLQHVLDGKRTGDVVSLRVYSLFNKQTRIVNIRVGG